MLSGRYHECPSFTALTCDIYQVIKLIVLCLSYANLFINYDNLYLNYDNLYSYDNLFIKYDNLYIPTAMVPPAR
jgi:hypothetical protein